MSAPTETIERITTPAKVERHPGDVNIVETTRRQAVRLRELLFGNTIQYKDSVDRFLTKHEEDMNKSWRDRFQNVFLHRFNTHFLEVTASLQAESYICDAMFNAANNVHLKPGEEYMG